MTLPTWRCHAGLSTGFELATPALPGASGQSGLGKQWQPTKRTEEINSGSEGLLINLINLNSSRFELPRTQHFHKNHEELLENLCN